MKNFKILCCLFLAVAGTALAQPAISEVTNAGSRIPSGFPGYGIAQGAILVVTGKSLGPDSLQQASFPLPTTDGLAGVTVQVAVGGTTVNGIMVYASAGEVGAILPSKTPVGTGTLTLNNNGQTTTAPITVVAASFGAFTQSQTGAGPAVAFNVAGDGTTALNTLTQPVGTGQAVMLNGTGLGAISSDETQSGVTDTPSTSVQVFVGLQKASVVSAGRGACCTGLDPSFAVPQGVAGWDVIQFTVPDGVTGCHVPVVVQIGNSVSNFSTIAVANGGACTDPGGISAGDLQNVSGNSVRIGSINLTRSSAKITVGGIGTSESKSDTGGAVFIQYDLTQLQSSATAFAGYSALGSCIVSTSKSAPGQTPVGPTITYLNAGNAINVKGPNGTKQMTPIQIATNATTVYSGDFGTSFVLPNIPGLPPGGIPGLPGSAPPFLDAGSYAIDNGSGGTDVGSFTASMTIPNALTWVNEDAITAVTRSQGVTVTWTGGDPNATVNIIGTSSNKVGTTTLGATFICTAPVSAGQFAVPSIVTLSLPVSTPTAGTTPGAPATPAGSLSVESFVSSRFTAPTIDIGTITSLVLATKNLNYQ